MAKQIQLRRGTTAENNAFKGALGEVTVNTDKKTLVIHDGITVGGTTLATLNASGKLPDSQLQLPTASTALAGIVQLNNTLTSTSTSQAATAAQVKALNDKAFGVGQSMQDVLASRVAGTTYTNTTARTIVLYISNSYVTGSNPTFNLYVDDVHVPAWTGVFVAPNSTYKIQASGYAVSSWVEFR